MASVTILLPPAEAFGAQRLGPEAARLLGRADRLLDRVFSDRGHQRRIVLSTPHFMSVPQIVANTDLVATVPTAMATHFAGLGPWQAFEPPINVPPYPVKQYWHARFHTDPGHIWLRRGVYGLFGA